MNNLPFEKSHEIQQAFGDVEHMYFVCHHIVHFSMLQNGYLDTSKEMSDILISKIVEHY